MKDFGTKLLLTTILFVAVNIWQSFDPPIIEVVFVYVIWGIALISIFGERKKESEE